MEQEEEKRKKAEQEAKETELQKKREEKRKAKEEEKLKQIKREHALMLIDRANRHYHKNLLHHKGIIPWIKFTNNMKETWQLAGNFYDKHLLNNVWKTWSTHTKEILQTKIKKAIKCFEQRAILHTFNAWKMVRIKNTKLITILVSI